MQDLSITTSITVAAEVVVHLVRLVQLGLQELQVERDHRDHRDLLAQLDQLALTDQADHKVML